MYKQIIIARKDLDLSPGKLAAQVSHASMAFLCKMIRDNEANGGPVVDMNSDSRGYYYIKGFTIDEGLYENWINDIFTKVILRAKNRNHLMKAVEAAEALGLKENEDFWLIKDCCLTELEPEETDENGVGRTLTCIGFKPMDSEIIDQIGKKYQLYQ